MNRFTKFFILSLSLSSAAFATDFNTSLPRGYFWSSFGKVSVNIYNQDYSPVKFASEAQRACITSQLKALNETIAQVQPKPKAISLGMRVGDGPDTDLDQVSLEDGTLRVNFPFVKSTEDCQALSSGDLRARFANWSEKYSETSANLKDYPAVQAEMDLLAKGLAKSVRRAK